MAKTSPDTTLTLRHGDEIIACEIVLRPRRRSFGIHVHADGRVRVLAPGGCDRGELLAAVQRRAGWICKQLAYFSRRERPAMLAYVDGETHRYLGEPYRLRVLAGLPGARRRGVRIVGDELRVGGPAELSPAQVERELGRWYRQRAAETFADVLAAAFVPFGERGHALPHVTIRDMRTRWGSMSPQGRMSLNLRLIHTPRACIEYVVAHELCHLTHRNHGPKFWALLESLMPDWRERKRRLEESAR